MRLLLDTHALLWWLEDAPKLGAGARDAIADSANEVWVSAASAWEIAIKMGLGRLKMKEAPEASLPREMKKNGFQTLGISHAHALAVRTLPPLHADPFDRMLVVQARLEGLTIVTADEILSTYGVATADATK